MRRTSFFFKRLFVLLASLIALCIFHIPALAVDGETFEIENIYYQVISEAEETVRITGLSGNYDYESNLGVVAIPKSVSHAGVEYTVTEVGDYCFLGNNNVVEVIMPDSIIALGQASFYSCASLERLLIPNKVSELHELTIVSCANLREIILPDSLDFIETQLLFEGCYSLESISIANNPSYYTQDGVLYVRKSVYADDYDGNIVIDEELVMLIKYPVAKPGITFEIPDGVGGIGQYAFYATNVATQLIVPASVKIVEGNAFGYWGILEKITFRGETPPFFPRNAFNKSGSKGIILAVPAEHKEAYEEALAGNRPLGKITYEKVLTEKKPDDEGGKGNDPGGNGPGGNNPGGNGPGDGSTPAWIPLSSGKNTDYASTQTTSDFRSLQGLLEKAIQSAIEANSGTASLQLKNFKSLDHETLKQIAAAAEAAGKNCTLYADTLEGDTVQVRIMFNPANATKAMQLNGSVNSAGTRNIDALFERSFKNKVLVLELGQQGGFGMTVSVGAKLNLTGFNTKSLCFYIYDKVTNTYNRIKNPKDRIDKNNYLWFNTAQAGYIIITDKPLSRNS